MIAIEKKPYNVAEILIKPFTSKAVGLVLRKTYSKKMAKISLSDSTIKTFIDEPRKDIECQILKNYKPHYFC